MSSSNSEVTAGRAGSKEAAFTAPSSPERVVLRDLRPDDLLEVSKWDADPDLTRLYGAPPSHLALYASRHLWAVEAFGRFVGLIGLSGVSRTARTAEVQILIGDPADRGKGVGRGALRAFLDRLLATTHLEFIYLRVLRGNGAAIRCYERCGFRRVGWLRVRSDPRYTHPPLNDDLLLMGLRPEPR